MYQDDIDFNSISGNHAGFIKRGQSESGNKRQKLRSDDFCNTSVYADFDETEDHQAKKKEYEEYQKTSMNMNPILFNDSFTGIVG